MGAAAGMVRIAIADDFVVCGLFRPAGIAGDGIADAFDVVGEACPLPARLPARPGAFPKGARQWPSRDDATTKKPQNIAAETIIARTRIGVIVPENTLAAAAARIMINASKGTLMPVGLSTSKICSGR